MGSNKTVYAKTVVESAKVDGLKKFFFKQEGPSVFSTPQRV